MNENILKRARAYLAKMPQAISGQGGDLATYKAACVLVKGFGLEQDEALPLLQDWNTSAIPPWTEAELRAKLQSASKSSKPDGYLLGASEQRQSTRLPTQSPTAKDVSASDQGALRRSTWPRFHPLTVEDVQEVCVLRKLPPEAVDLCAKAGFLVIASMGGQRCFVIRGNRCELTQEAQFAQARRFDGMPFTLADGRTVKAKNLPGSHGAFVGAEWLGKTSPVLLVEGVIGLLEGVAAAFLADRLDWTVVAATSAGSRFSRDPKFLAKLRGRHVRILADPDVAGMNGAVQWMGALEAAGARVDAMTLPSEVKDLGPLVAEPERFRGTLDRLFLC